MIFDFEDVIDKAEIIHADSVKAIEKYIPRRGTLRFYFDSRTTDEVHPFAYGNGFYYVCCPCCYQIERITEAQLKRKVACANKKAIVYQVFIVGEDEVKIKRDSYSVKLDKCRHFKTE